MKFMQFFLLTVFFTVAAMGQVSNVNPTTAVTRKVTYSVGTTPIVVARNSDYGVIDLVTVLASTASGDFTANSSDNTLTKTAHGYGTGLIVKVSSDTTLAAPLVANTNYFVIENTANKFYLATTLASAQAGTAIDISTDGTGAQHVVPVALVGASVKLQGSMNNSGDWTDIPIRATGDATKSLSVTTDVNAYLHEWNLAFNYVRQYYTITSGQLNVSEISKVKGLVSP